MSTKIIQNMTEIPIENTEKTISEHIRVFCRQKPELPEDPTSDESTSVDMTAQNDGADAAPGPCVSWNAAEGTCEYRSGVSSKNNQTFRFDGVFGVEASQQTVFEAAARPIVDSVLQGYSGTIFAYGPTGAGA